MDYSYNAAGESTGWSWVNGQESATVSLTRDSAGRISATSATTMGLSLSEIVAPEGVGRAVYRDESATEATAKRGGDSVHFLICEGAKPPYQVRDRHRLNLLHVERSGFEERLGDHHFPSVAFECSGMWHEGDHCQFVVGRIVS